MSDPKISECKKNSIPRNSSYDSLYVNPLNELKHNRSCSDCSNGSFNGESLGYLIRRNPVVCSENKENETPNVSAKRSYEVKKENVLVPRKENFALNKDLPSGNSDLKERLLKPSSLQLCMQKHEPDSAIGSKFLDPIDSNVANSGNIWDYSDSEAAPAASWSTLPNRSLLCRPLPLDIGRCTCVIVKEKYTEGLDGGTLYTLYTNEGQGRQNRKLAVAHHRRRNGKSEFTVAQDKNGILSTSDESLIGHVTSNFVGSTYHIWDQVKGNCLNSLKMHPKLLSVVEFMPTITTWTGCHRRMKACIPKHQSMLLKNTSQIQHINGLPKDWEERMDNVHQLFSKAPIYNKISKQYELDFRDRGRAGLRIQSSVKNFQLTLEKNGRQTILQLGRVGKAMYVMDYRYPLTGYQAFSICLASIDSKLCCTI